MKKKLWLLILISICLIIGIYFLFINNQSDWELSRVDGIPTFNSSGSDATQTASSSTDKTGQTDEPAPEQSSGSPVPENIDQRTPTNTPKPNNQNTEQPLPSTGNISGNTMSNSSVGGALSTDGKWEYGSISDIAHRDNKLYKININSTECIQLTDYNVGYINNVEDWIYYIKYKDGGSDGIYRIKNDGTQEQQIYKEPCSNIIIVGDIIYLFNLNDYNVYSIKTDGSELKLLIQNGEPFQYENGFLYFKRSTETDDLYRVSITNINEKEKIEDNVWKYIVYNNSIYYQKYDDLRLYKKNIGESASKVINNKVNTPSFFIENDKIYFMTGITENENIYTMDLEGKNIEVFFNGGVENPVRSIYGVVGESVYFWIMRDPYGSGDDELAKINSDGSVTLLRDILSN